MSRKKSKALKKLRTLEAQSGVASGGESINPWGLPEEAAIDTGAGPKAAPPPGIPVSENEYKRMKEAAKHKAARRKTHAQEDRSSTEKK